MLSNQALKILWHVWINGWLGFKTIWSTKNTKLIINIQLEIEESMGKPHRGRNVKGKGNLVVKNKPTQSLDKQSSNWICSDCKAEVEEYTKVDDHRKECEMKKVLWFPIFYTEA